MATAAAAAVGSTGGRSSSPAAATSGSLTAVPPIEETVCASRASAQTAATRASSITPMSPPGWGAADDRGGDGEGVAVDPADEELHPTAASASAVTAIPRFTLASCSLAIGSPGQYPVSTDRRGWFT
jgi:hypothetical protein